MFFSRKPVELPTQAEALPGRDAADRDQRHPLHQRA